MVSDVSIYFTPMKEASVRKDKKVILRTKLYVLN